MTIFYAVIAKKIVVYNLQVLKTNEMKNPTGFFKVFQLALSIRKRKPYSTPLWQNLERYFSVKTRDNVHLHRGPFYPLNTTKMISKIIGWLSTDCV